jgi:hypothetical protein
MITSNDVFGNKYLVMFDYNDELGWGQVALERVERRLEELTVRITTLIQSVLQSASKL